jgi:hypothetical protein
VETLGLFFYLTKGELMTTFDILAKFLEMYPQFHEQICQYAPNGFSSIIVWFKNGQTFDFTYFTDNTWSFRPHERRKYAYQPAYKGRFLR